MNKSFLELSCEGVNAMIQRGYLRFPTNRTLSLEESNVKAIHTYGWAVEEMYREIEAVPKRVKEPRKEKKSKIITEK